MLHPLLRLTSAAVLLSGLALGQPAAAQVACPAKDSGGSPAIDAEHIFCGEINNSGRATGFHSRPGGVNPASVRNTGSPVAIPGAPAGIYLLSNFTIAGNGRSAVKAISTMYPDSCSPAQVLAAIRNAATTGQVSGRQFNGLSGTSCQAGNPPAPFRIKGFFNNSGGIATAYPNY